MLKQQLTQEEVVTLSVVYDAETTTHTRRSCYTLRGLHNNSTTPQQPHLEPELTIAAA
jgi:hypothetical protein